MMCAAGCEAHLRGWLVCAAVRMGWMEVRSVRVVERMEWIVVGAVRSAVRMGWIEDRVGALSSTIITARGRVCARSWIIGTES